MRTPTVLATRIRRVAAAWRRPGRRGGARIVQMCCPYCREWRPARYFRCCGGGCRKCIGNG
jgi:hypothetical protein